MNIYDIEKFLNKKDILWLSNSKHISNIKELKKSDKIRVFNSETKKLSKRIQYIMEVYSKDKIIKVKYKNSNKGKYIYFDRNLIFVGDEEVRHNRATMMKEILNKLDNKSLKITKLK